MRIWSIHPKYLDAKGLVALWRETLLAKKVLEGKTTGYRNHPQLERFKQSGNPLDSINQYLSGVYKEAVTRGYNFNRHKFDRAKRSVKLTVTSGQIEYETSHLLRKLRERQSEGRVSIGPGGKTDLHPLFRMVQGGVEEWEIIAGK